MKPFLAQYRANRKLVIASQDICAICGLPVDKTLKYPNPLSPTVDHIIPVTKGGHPSDISNLQLAHRSCNRAKGTQIAPDIPKAESDPNRDLPQSKDWRTA